jgi:hypothetical protein
MFEVCATEPLAQMSILDLVASGNKVWALVCFLPCMRWGILMWPKVDVNGKFEDGSAYGAEVIFMTELAEENGGWKIIETKEFVDSAIVKDTSSRFLK